MDSAELLSLPDQICFWPRWLLRLYGFINIPAFLQQSLRRLKEELWLQPSWVRSIGHEQAGVVTQLPDRSVKVLWQLYDTKCVEITNITEFMPIYDMLSVALSCLPSVALAWLPFSSLPQLYLSTGNSLLMQAFSRSVKCLSSVAKGPAWLGYFRKKLSFKTKAQKDKLHFQGTHNFVSHCQAIFFF